MRRGTLLVAFEKNSHGDRLPMMRRKWEVK